ncbi:hypothetical protein [Acinetobacter sp. WU_MDCI_Abxc222]|uniref:hypothetical protein n=1 Tax=Acinetobacter sp. WU_MDCI_Abxc222 TaxID=2850076 RepID=UPI0021CD6B81|nr:hypothetical protein [Acinetobacter sp. WU_MDCI_Abxc222]MCU4564448.1 hypothetical protein [Acinetobacter sp. WU_MDCI_Abxc222]
MSKLNRYGIQALILSFLCISRVYAFDLYHFIDWRDYTNSQGKKVTTQSKSEFDDFLKSQNIKRFNLFYMSSLITNHQVDPKKIKKAVEIANQTPSVPVCFDIETGTESHVETTLPLLLDALKMYRDFGGIAPIGVYGVLPEITPNTYLSETQKDYFRHMNDKYEELANHVDYLFPTLYFYSLDDMKVWDAKAEFSIAEAKRFAKNREIKILPFLSTSTWVFPGHNTFKIKPLSEVDMLHSLKYLKNLGADGVMLWEGPLKTQNNPVIFDVNKKSFKAIVKFAKQYGGGAN